MRHHEDAVHSQERPPSGCSALSSIKAACSAWGMGRASGSIKRPILETSIARPVPVVPSSPSAKSGWR